MSGIKRTIPTNQYLAALNANNPNGVNTFATLADVVGGSGGNQIISGAASYSGAGLTYDVSVLVYTIQGTLYSTAAPTQVTLAAADPTFDRIDVIYVDDTQTVGVITGVPSASPVKPQVDNLTQVEVTFVTVPAGAVSPGVTIEEIYEENAGAPAEWNTSTTAPLIFNSIVAPYAGTFCIETTANFGANKYAAFTPAAPYTMAGGILTFWLKAKNNMSVSTGKFLVGFYVGGSLVGNSVTIGGTPSSTFGFLGGVIGTWQLVSIPISAFGGLPANVDQLRFFTTGGSNTAQFYADRVRILEGVPTPPAPIAGHEIQDEGIALIQRPILDFQGAGVTATDDALNGKTVVTIPLGVNIYNSDGQLTGLRIVDLNGSSLIFAEIGQGSTIFGGSFLDVASAPGSGSPAYYNLNADNNTVRALNYKTSGTNRWALLLEDNETGLVQGANFVIQGYDDAGLPMAKAIKIRRVDGAITLNEEYTLPTSDGLSGQVPTTDGVGNVTWQTPKGHVIEDEGTPLTQRTNMNFTGAGVTVTDAGGKTVVTIPGGGGPGSMKYSRNIWMYNVVGAVGYTWNGVSVASPTAAITSTAHPHRLFNCSGTNNQHQGVYFEQQLPSYYTAGANIRVVLNVTALTATGGAVFYCGLTQPTAANVLGGTTETEWIAQTATFTGVTGYHVVPLTYTFTGTNITPGDSLLFRIYRDPNDAGDTLGTVGMVSIQIEEL